MKKIIIIGGKGNGTLVLSAIENINNQHKEWKVLGFLNDRETEPIANYPILGKVEKKIVQEYLLDKDVYFFYTLISVKWNHKFLYKLKSLEIPIERFATIIDPSANIAKEVNIGYGSCILQGANICSFTNIGNFVQILSHALICSSVIINDYSYVAGKGYVGAYSHLKEGAYMGAASSIIEFKTMGEWSVAGMGAVVVKDVLPYSKVVGNPAKEIGTTK